MAMATITGKDAAIKRYVDEPKAGTFLESWSNYETMC
jgi:hypothetical protein